MLRRAVASVTTLALVALGLAGAATSAQAVGSGDLYPSTTTSARAGIEWRTNTYGPSGGAQILRRTMLSVYAVAGEQILLGSSSLPATNAGSSDIQVWNPGLVTNDQTWGSTTLPASSFSCVAQRAQGGNGTRGYIGTRAAELAGAQSINGANNTGGYRPCYYTAPTTGVYRVAFYGTDGATTSNEDTPSGVIAPTTFPTYRSAVAAWDVTVRPAATSSVADITGRVFTYVLGGFGPGATQQDLTLYLTTLDGFRYSLDTRGFDPGGFLLYGNDKGFLNTDGTALNHDILATTGSANQWGLASTQGAVTFQAPQYPLSFEPLAAETITALGITTSPEVPAVSNTSYTGQVGNTSYFQHGGTIKFTSTAGGSYEIVLSRDGTYDPGSTTNRVLRGTATAGVNTVSWDGKDNAGAYFPVGTDYPYSLSVHVGEYHAPMIDIESAVNGSPTVTLLNPPGGVCPFTGEASDGTNCTRVFYDDRAYRTAAGTTVGNLTTGNVCGTVVAKGATPNPLSATVTGVDSRNSYRIFGDGAGYGSSQVCTTSTTFGDAKGLDVWTYFPSSSVSSTLNVEATPPTIAAAADAYTTAAGDPITAGEVASVLANDTGAHLSVTTSTAASHGSAAIDATGVLTYTPAAGFSGTDTLSYTITDGLSAKTATVTITVTPVGATDSGAVAVNGTLTVPAASGLLSNDAGTGLTVTAVTQPGHGTVTFAADGSYTYNPSPNYSGTDSFTYTARDSSGQSYTQTVSLKVTPTAADDSATTDVDTAVSGNVLSNDHGSLSITAHTDPSSGALTAFDPTTGAYTYEPAAGFSGTDSFTYTVSDGVSLPITKTVTILVRPDAANDSATTPAQTPISGNVLANDHGSLDITGHTMSAHGGLTFDSSGAYTYTPGADFSGTDSFTYTVDDHVSPAMTRTVTLTVTPVGVNDAATTAVDDPLTSAETTNVLVNDFGSLTVTSSTAASHGTATVDPAGTWSYSPDEHWSGTDTFTYTAKDAANQSVTQTVTVTVTPTAGDDSGTTPVDTDLIVGAGAGLLHNDVGHLTAAKASDPTSGHVTVNDDGSYTYTPTSGFSGTDSFTYTASDGTTTLTRTVSLVVTPTGQDDANHTGIGQTLTVDAANGVLSNDNGTLHVATYTQPGQGSVTVATDGSYVYTPPAGWSGTTTFTYTATDGHTPLTQTVTITVTPTAADDAGTTPVNTTLTVAAPGVLANDHGTGLTVVPASVSTPAHGDATVNADGSWSYQPDHDWSGIDTFTYTATDGHTQVTATVDVTVTPTGGDDAATTDVGVPVTFTGATSVLADDHGDLHVTGITQPAAGKGSASFSGGDVTYTPPIGWSGIATFTYTAADTAGQTVTPTVTVTVEPAGDDDTGSVAVLGTLTVDADHGVLANDHGDLQVTAHTNPSHGSLTINSDGSYEYKPTGTFSGSDSFTYTATDGSGQTVTQTVLLTVTPTAADDGATTPVGTPVDIDVLANDSGALHVSALGTGADAPSHGTVSINGDGTVNYDPVDGWSGTDTFAYTATDGTTTVTKTVSVVVEPSVTNDTGSTVAGTPLVVIDPDDGVLGNDEGNLTAAVLVGPAHGDIVLNDDGTYTYTPDPDFSGTDSFTYAASDGTTTLTATATITVTPTAADDTYSMQVNGTLAPGISGGVLANDLGTLTSSLVTGPTNGDLTLNDDGSFTYKPADGFSGTDTFWYTADDRVSPALTQKVTITVTPLAFDDSGTTTVGTPLVVVAGPLTGMLSNDVGSVHVSGIATAPANGSLTWDADGSYTYTPDDHYSGTDSFVYTATDGTTTYTRTVHLTVTPTVADDEGTTAVNTTLTVPATGVLGNDDGTLAVVAGSVSDPAHGTATVASNGAWTFTPDTDWSGIDTFTYDASDGTTTRTATVTVTVTPTGHDDSGTTPVNTALTFTGATSVLHDDHGDLHVTALTQPDALTGSVTRTGDVVTFTPATDWSGVTTFTYTAADTAGQEVTQTVTVKVTPTADDDSGSVATGGTLTVPAASGLLADDHGSLHVTAVDTPAHGSIVWNPDGSYVYTAPADYSGPVVFDYTASDGTTTVTATITIVVEPQAADDDATTPVGTPLVVTDPALGVLGNDDPTLQVTGMTGVAHGTIDWDDDGTYTYTPAAHWSGTETISYTATDGTTPVTRTLTIVVTPTAQDDAGTTAAGVTLTTDAAHGVLANDDGHLTASVTTDALHGDLTLSSNGSYTYVPDADWSGVEHVTYTASDGTTDLVRNLTITVTPVGADNSATTPVNDPLTSAETTNVLANDLGALSVTSSTAAGHGTATVAGDGSWTYEPNHDWSGTDTFGYTATDGAGQTVTQLVTVVVTPTGGNDVGATGVNVPLVVVAADGVLGNDHGALAVTAGTFPTTHGGSVTIDALGGYTYTPATDFSGVDTFTYAAFDGTTTLHPTVAITVTPTAANDTAATTVDVDLTVVAADGVLANDHGSLSVTDGTFPTAQGGSVQMADDGSYTYSPPAGWSGTDTFTYEATDGTTTLVRTVTVTVSPTAADDHGTTPVNTTLTVDAAHGVLANDAGHLHVVSNTQPSDCMATVAADGSYTYVPDPDFSGTDSFTYTATDGTTTVTRTVYLTVTPTAAVDSGTTPVDTVLVVGSAAGVLANDHGSLTVTASTDPGHGDVTVSSNGAYTYTPDAHWSGTDTFTYTASDGVSADLVRTVTIVVTPTGTDDAETTPVNTTLVVADADGVLGNDNGTLAVDSWTDPDHGTVSMTAGGGYTYSPPADWSGLATFTYTAVDDTSSVTQTVRIVVVPTAVDYTGSVAAGASLTVPPASGLRSAGTPGSLQVTAVSDPPHGTVTWTAGDGYTYTPDAGFSGTDTFTYTVTDGTTTLTRTVTIDVVPTAADDAITVPAGTPTTVPAGEGVLSNDLGTLTVTGSTAPGTGTVSVQPDGSFTYTPPDGWSGVTTFDYTATDGASHTVTRTVTLTVAPVATDDAYATGATTTLTVSAAEGLLANDRGALVVVGNGDPGHGTVTVEQDGSFVYTPTPGWFGTDTFTYTVSDGVNPPVTRTVTITVAPPAVAPAGVDDTRHGKAGEPTTLSPLDNDPPGDHLTWRVGSLVLVDPATGAAVTQVVVPGQGVWRVLADDDVVFTPVAGFAGVATLDYRATNSAGQEVTAVLSIDYRVLAATGSQVALLALLATLLLTVGVTLTRIRRRPVLVGARHARS